MLFENDTSVPVLPDEALSGSNAENIVLNCATFGLTVSEITNSAVLNLFSVRLNREQLIPQVVIYPSFSYSVFLGTAEELDDLFAVPLDKGCEM